MLPFLFLAVFAAIAVLVIYLSHQATQRRIAEMSAFAASKGWTYSVADPYNLPARWGGPPFAEGYARVAEHVITGTAHGRPLVAFDYRYKEDSQDNDGHKQTWTYQFNVCVLRMPAGLPELRVSPEGFLSRIGQAFGVSDIELESEDFNRAYKVRCDDPKFASDVLHPRAMEMLLHCDPRLQFRFWGNDLISWSSGRGSPAQIVMRAEVLSRIIESVPDFVWKDHGAAGG